MRPLIILSIFCLALSCTKKETKLSNSCVEIMESDSFYYALPLDELQYKAMYRTENYITQVIDSQVQNIDFDCAVVVNPSEEEISNLRKTMGQDFDESFRISTKHSEAIKCMIESKGIRTVVVTEQFIRFVTKSRTWDLDVQKDNIPDWKFILFKEGKDPMILPSLTLTVEDVEQYFLGLE